MLNGLGLITLGSYLLKPWWWVPEHFVTGAILEGTARDIIVLLIILNYKFKKIFLMEL